jgi:hypothetical protein
MRRSPACTVLLGFAVLAGLLSLSACLGQGGGKECSGGFERRLNCLAGQLAEDNVTVTLRPPLSNDVPEKVRQDAERNVRDRSHRLVVKVPKDARTGEGGTVLLLLADARLVDRNARIDRLDPEILRELESLNVCTLDSRKETLCQAVTRDGTKGPLLGGDLIDRHLVDGPGGSGDGNSQLPLILTVVGALAVLVAAFLYLVHRSRGPGAPEGRPLAAAGVGAVSPNYSAGHDQPTRPLRPKALRTAVVRTELHPQGYVEVEHVLYRAVWAEPHRPPPGPGGLVDVTEFREATPVPEVLYAYPSTRRHAK